MAAQDSTALNAEIESIDAQLKELETTIAKYDAGLIKLLALSRREALLLSKTLVLNRINATEGKAIISVQLPAIMPNEELANKLLGEMVDQQSVVNEAIKEAKNSGGLIQALALSRVETEKLSLSQLQMAYLQAKYGIAFPKFANDSLQNTNNIELSNSDNTDGEPISDIQTNELEDEGSSSNWVFVEKLDKFTDKNASYIYLNASGYVSSDSPESIVVRCDGTGSYEIYVRASGYIGARNDIIRVRYRFGSDQAISERWSESTTGRAAFLPSGYKDFRQKLATGEDFLFEITDYNGTPSSSEFDNNQDDKLTFVMNGCK